jgi:hypothetical protein
MSKTPSQKRAGGVTQGVGSEFKPQCRKIKELRSSILVEYKKYKVNSLCDIMVWIQSVTETHVFKSWSRAGGSNH